MCRYGYCVSPTGGYRQNRYILKQCSAYGADIITPHLPQAVFQWRFYAGTDTVIAVARPVGSGKTATKGRPMAALFLIMLRLAPQI